MQHDTPETGTMPATWKEIVDTLFYLEALPVTISPKDYQLFIKNATKDDYEPNTLVDFLQAGFMGTIRFMDRLGPHVYVSRAIPPGYYYPSHTPELRISNDTDEVPEKVARTVALDLKPLKAHP